MISILARSPGRGQGPWWYSLALALALTGSGATAAEPSLTMLPLGFEVREFRGPGSRVAATAPSVDAFRGQRLPPGGPVVIVWGEKGAAALTLGAGGIQVRPARAGGDDLRALETRPEAIPGSRVAADGPRTVILAEPTRDYAHEALGSPVHARTLVIAEKQATPVSGEPKPVPTAIERLPAGPASVWEDREARIVDLDGDGRPEILAVRSERARGSALTVIGFRDGAWRVVAETPPDGEPFRWLDPAAARRGEIAIVRRPHLDGVLQLWRWEGGQLALRAERAGYSNHAYGSTAQTLAAELGGGGEPMRLALPTLDRQALAIVRLGDTIDEIARIPLPAKATTGVAALGRGADQHVLVGLEDGRVADIALGPLRP